jgi:hypothetical protein
MKHLKAYLYFAHRALVKLGGILAIFVPIK